MIKKCFKENSTLEDNKNPPRPAYYSAKARTIRRVVFKCLRGLAPKYLSSRFNTRFNTRASVHWRNTRNKNMLDIPAFNTAAGQHSFIYRAVKCWNMLPEEMTKCENLHSLKSKAKSRFFTQLLTEFITFYYFYCSFILLCIRFRLCFLLIFVNYCGRTPLGALIKSFIHYKVMHLGHYQKLDHWIMQFKSLYWLSHHGT